MNFHNTVLPVLSQALPTDSVPLLELFFPGISVVASTIKQAVEGKTQGMYGFLLALGVFTLVATFAYSYVERFVNKHFTSTVLISSSDEVRELLPILVYTYGLDQGRSTVVRMPTREGYLGIGEDLDNSGKRPLCYTPWNGQCYFWHEGNLFGYRCVARQDQWGLQQQVYIHCYGRTSKPIQDLLEECRAQLAEKTKRRISLFHHRENGWYRVAMRESISLDTVVLDVATKQRLVEDFKSFLEQESREHYRIRGLSYRRGYLLHGPPGTGKTSISVALASHFEMDIYTMSLAAIVDDKALNQCFEKLLAHRCMILLEDVDAIATSRQIQTNDSVEAVTKRPWSGISLSGLLNVIDGVAAVDDRVLVMTTNHPERLDRALTRPGRIDMKVELGLLNRPMIIEYMQRIYAQPIHGDEDAQTKYNSEVGRIAREVAEKMPESTYAPAELRSLCLENLKSPQGVLDNLDKWMIDQAKA